MKAMMGVVIAILVVSILTLFWPRTAEETAVSSDISKTKTTATTTSASAEIIAEEDRSEKMQAAYAELEKARKKLQRALAELQHEMWGMSFPPDQAREIKEIMLNAHKFEKTPMMLGAFRDVSEINSETDKVMFAIKSLQEISESLQQGNVAAEAKP